VVLVQFIYYCMQFCKASCHLPLPCCTLLYILGERVSLANCERMDDISYYILVPNPVLLCTVPILKVVGLLPGTGVNK
jgi:hypothetical protein